MNKYNSIRLKPDEYVTTTNLNAYIFSRSWILENGIIITKDAKNIRVHTPYSVDKECEIEVKYNEKDYTGRVKYLSSTPRRKYYMFLKWYIIILQVLSVLFMIYEVEVCGNYAIKGSRSNYLLSSILVTWLTYCIVFLRNNKSITKWIITIFCYFLLIASTYEFITYISILLCHNNIV